MSIKYCVCPKWKKYIERINDIIYLHAIRRNIKKPLGDDYEIFDYCPWCGAKLYDDKNELPET